jgi:hypothetical protein
MTSEHNSTNRVGIETVVSIGRRSGFFPIRKGMAILASKCPHGCGPTALHFRNKREVEVRKCFRCKKWV